MLYIVVLYMNECFPKFSSLLTVLSNYPCEFKFTFIFFDKCGAELDNEVTFT